MFFIQKEKKERKEGAKQFIEDIDEDILYRRI